MWNSVSHLKFLFTYGVRWGSNSFQLEDQLCWHCFFLRGHPFPADLNVYVYNNEILLYLWACFLDLEYFFSAPSCL